MHTARYMVQIGQVKVVDRKRGISTRNGNHVGWAARSCYVQDLSPLRRLAKARSLGWLEMKHVSALERREHDSTHWTDIVTPVVEHKGESGQESETSQADVHTLSVDSS